MNSKASFRYDALIRREYLEDEKVSFSVFELPGLGINSENYKIAFDDADKNLDPIHLKILHKWDVNLADKLEICEHCFEADVKTAEIIKTKGGNYFVKETDFIAVCFRYYEAQEYTASQKERAAAARELGKLNNALSKYKEEFRRNKLYDFLTEDEFDTIKQACIDMDEFERTVSDNIERILEFTKRLSPKFKADKYSYRLEHFDYYPKNLIFKNGDVAAILDFDSILSAPKHLSAAFACDRFSETASESDKTSKSEKVSKMMEFLRTYKQFDNSFGPKELPQTPALVKWEALQRINYILRSYFFEHDSSWNNEIGHQLDIINRTNEIEEEFLALVETESL